MIVKCQIPTKKTNSQKTLHEIRKKNNDDQNQRCDREDVISLNDYQRFDAKTDNREKKKTYY